MTDIGVVRREINEAQKQNRRMLEHGTDHAAAIGHTLTQHAMMHGADLGADAPYSYADLVLAGVDEAMFRVRPEGMEHSIAWCLYHIGRIEDAALSGLVGQRAEVFDLGGWEEKLNAGIRHTGNEIDDAELATLSAGLDFEAVRAYRLAVGQSTQEIIARLTPEDMDRKTDPADLERLVERGTVRRPISQELLDYWAGLTVVGLLLMPATRHSFTHLTEVLKLKGKEG